MFSTLKPKAASVGSCQFIVGCLHTQTQISKTFWHSPIHQTLHSLLDQCCSMKQLKRVHAQIILHGLAGHVLTLGKLVSFCATPQVGDLRYAQLLFDQIPQPNKFMYNHLIRGYSNSHDPIKSLLLYRQMMSAGLIPNQFTIPFVVKACAFNPSFWEAVVVHAQAIKLGMGSHVCVQNAFLSAYVACRLMPSARQVFDDISDRTLVSWNSMIAGYSKMGCCKEAILLFREMRHLGLDPDVFTLVSLLSVSSKLGDLDLGRFVHFYIVVTGIEIDSIVTNALIDMYAKCGHLQNATRVFDRMHDKDVVSWTCMVNAYANHGLIDYALKIFNQMPVKNVVSWNSIIWCHVQEGQYTEAVELFCRMIVSGVMPDDATLVSILSSCSHMGDLALGKQAHNYVCDNNITVSVTLCNSLIDMYAKCGALQTAMDIFFGMPEKNVVSWNVIIGALALHGFGEEAVEMFEKMQASGLSPDEITFTGLLSACSHSGFVDLGRHYFDTMSSTFGISPDVEHYACMVDLLGRGGFLGEAMALIQKMPIKPDVVVWGALLGACRTYGNLEIGKQIMKQLLELGRHDSGLYVLLSNMYSESQRWDDMNKIRKIMDESGIKKCRAISFIEIDGSCHQFMVDDKSHGASTSISSLLDQLMDHLKFIEYPCKPSDAEEIYYSAYVRASSLQHSFADLGKDSRLLVEEPSLMKILVPNNRVHNLAVCGCILAK
ncbi:pentatricopeptide repeat-containing protein At2g22410, mitochondrial-like [Gastrolobium bilobum]|uniref:pentatricopeptide repeat-containing protein At2g22410, mitochondrial-like n=1 Tax=Gastrolobium bilobum TaxID=150636 RepID=UPI002AB05746|nr:pentatricopeptide repeat-containing protein At2g22410, mitochondrial-like [Gastrolobium bilobum]